MQGKYNKSIMNRNMVFLLAIFLFTDVFPQQYGLSFNSHSVLKDQRTEIVLTPEKDFTFNDEFELSFDLSKYRTEKDIYGYVFRIILNGELNIDLLHGNRTGEDRDFSIIEGNKKSEIAFNLDSTFLNGNWVNFRIKFLLKEDKIIFYEQDNVYVDSSIDLDPRSHVGISFGACSRDNFISWDVPPIMIRDIKLYGKEKLQNHWLLDENGGENAYDILSGNTARVNNPNWLRHAHLHWNRIRELNFGGNTQIAENPEEEKIYWLGEDFLIVFDAAKNLFDTIYYSDRPGFLTQDGQAVFDPLNGKIISYNLDSRQVFTIDPVSGEISMNELEPYVWKNYKHHNKHYSKADSFLYIFNGYGHYQYKDSVFRSKVSTGIWEELEVLGDQPAPRYLSASGFLNDTLYFLGGYGSESGMQMLSPRHYYDLYAFSMEEFRFIKKDSFPKPAENYCLANSMVIDPETRNYYALSFPEFTYNSRLQLLMGSLDRGTLERMGDTIPYPFNDMNSFADLYYFPKTEKMFAVTLLSDDLSGTKTILYSIGFPPITDGGAKIKEVKQEKSFWIILLIIPGVIFLWLIIRFIRSKRIEKATRPEKSDESPGAYPETSEKKNAIFFFGGFQVFDRTGIDITNKFTPLLKELFLIIILHSIKNEKGISSERIIEILWFDKSERNARNNLSVNITKLKTFLTGLDDCELTHETGYWKIHQRKGIQNDYCEARKIVSNKDSVHSQEINRLISIANKGPFLFNLSFEWLDVFKARISDRITDVLLSFAESLDVNDNAELIIDLADCLFNFDIVNEEIMVLKCRAQYGQGKHSLAKNSYQNFCNEYKLLYGEDYSRSFTDIVSNGN